MHRLPAECRNELFVRLLCLWCRHAVGGVEPGQRSDGIDAASGSVGESVPAHLFQVGEFHVAPRFDVLRDDVEILRRGEFREFFPVGSGDADHPVVEINPVVCVDKTHGIGPVRELFRRDQRNVLLVGEDDILEDAERKFGELDGFVGELPEGRNLFRGEPLRHSPRQTEDRVDDLSSEMRDEFPEPFAHRDDLLPRLHADLLDHPRDVPHLLRGVGADDEIRTAEYVDVEGMVLEHERVVNELPYLLRSRRGIDVV